MADVIIIGGSLIWILLAYFHSFYESNKRVARMFNPSYYCFKTGKRLYGFVFIFISVGKGDCDIQIQNNYTHNVLKSWHIKSNHKAFKVVYIKEQYLTFTISGSDDFVTTITSFSS